MGRVSEILRSKGFRLRIAVLAGGLGAVLGLVSMARFRPSWPWFSLWIMALVLGLGLLSLPAIRKALNLSWFGVTLLMLIAVLSFDLYLFHVETHRQRSERLEFRGVYFDADQKPIRIGAGYPDLDVRLDGSFYQFDRWSLDLRKVGAREYVLDNLDQVHMLRLPRRVWWKPGGTKSRPAIGGKLGRGSWVLPSDSTRDLGFRLTLLKEGKRGVLAWGERKAPLSVEDSFLDGRLLRRMAQGISLSDLEWDSIPDRGIAEDLVLTQVRPGRSFGRIRAAFPEYRIVSKTNGEALGPDGPPLITDGDTVWVNSRGKTWAFSIDRVPGVSRVAAPLGIHFVRRPRPAGWPLPSPEACGADTDRCAVLSTGSLPPPQAQFDLGGFGLDTSRYSILARLETDGEGVRFIGAGDEARSGYGELLPLAALPVSEGLPDAGVLLSVQRAAQGQQSAVFFTVFGLFLLVLGALATVSGNSEIWGRRKAVTPNMSAAWAFVNVFLIFLGLRLALGLRVAYSPPYYNRAAATAVGLWIAFAVMLVALGRWASWAPAFWRALRWLDRPLARMFLPGVNGVNGVEGVGGVAGANDPRGESGSGEVGSLSPEEKRTRNRGRFRSALGLLLMFPSIGLLIWQRPEAAASLVVAGTGIAAWLVMGVSRRKALKTGFHGHPLDVITAEESGENPALSLALAAGGSVVLALAIHAPWMALVPVVLLLVLFGVDRFLGGWGAFSSPTRRGWGLFVFLALLGEVGVLVFLPWPGLGSLVLGLFAGFFALLFQRSWGDRQEPLILAAHRGFMEVGRGTLSGLGWVGVLLVLGLLLFLSAQAIPPFVRFALVFILLLMAIRAGLACHALLDTPEMKNQLQALGVLVIPLGVLMVFMLFDFGLGLVFFIPMFLTVLLAARIDRLPKVLMGSAVAMAVTIAVFAWSVLNPSVAGLRNAPDVPTFSSEFEGVGNPFSDLLRKAGLGGPVTRASIRSIAASDPELLEEALAFAGPSPALFAAAPSRDQVWGGRAYASSGFTGTGFAGTAILGRGIPTAVSYAENTFSVYVLSEHGALGGISVLLVYLALLIVVGVWIFRVHRSVQESRDGLAVLAMTVGGVLWLTLPAIYVAASNLAMVPLTGQNMPFLGLNSWADVVLASGLATGIIFGLAALPEPGSRKGGA